MATLHVGRIRHLTPSGAHCVSSERTAEGTILVYCPFLAGLGSESHCYLQSKNGMPEFSGDKPYCKNEQEFHEQSIRYAHTG